MALCVLNVAEKPSVAKEVSRILSNGTARSRRGRCAVFCALRAARAVLFALCRRGM